MMHGQKNIKLIFYCFSKSCRENSSLITTCMNNGYSTCKRTYNYGNILLNSWKEKCFQRESTHILRLITSERKSCRLWDNVEKFDKAKNATDDGTFGQTIKFANSPPCACRGSTGQNP